MAEHFYGTLFTSLRKLVRLVYPRYTAQVLEHNGFPAVYVMHHQNLFGPFIALLWFPKDLHAWILHVFLNQRDCYKQLVDYTLTKRMGINKHLAKLLALPLSYFTAKLLNSGKGIPVYRGSRKIVHTFQQSLEVLKKGESIVIFPDIDYRDQSPVMKEMYDGFLYLEKYYYNSTGKHLCFIPLYVSRKKKKLLADQHIYFRDGEAFSSEQKVVYQKIRNKLNQLAQQCGDI
jgi:hypothetical protein